MTSKTKQPPMTDKPAATIATKTLEKIQLELRDTLEMVGVLNGEKVVEVVSFGSRNNDLRLLFRVHDEAAWLKVLGIYLIEEADAGWYSYWGKKYMVRDGRLLYGWTCMIAADDLDDTVQQVRRMLIRADHQVNSASRRTTTTVELPSDLGYSEKQQNRVKLTTVPGR